MKVSRTSRTFAGWTARLLALLLGVVVAGQMTDLLPCADESGTMTTASGESDMAPFDHGAAGGVALDCLCHVSFVRTDVPPAAVARAASAALLRILDPVPPPDVISAPPAPVPLG
jgi:hypothetical protein